MWVSARASAFALADEHILASALGAAEGLAFHLQFRTWLLSNKLGVPRDLHFCQPEPPYLFPRQCASSEVMNVWEPLAC